MATHFTSSLRMQTPVVDTSRDGKLLVVIGARKAWGDLLALVAEAGFTRIRELASDDHESSTLELQR